MVFTGQKEMVEERNETTGRKMVVTGQKEMVEGRDETTWRRRRWSLGERKWFNLRMLIVRVRDVTVTFMSSRSLKQLDNVIG